jgi:AraC family transcriptional regulator
VPTLRGILYLIMPIYLYAEYLANVLVIHLWRNYSIASPQLDDGETKLSQVQLQKNLDYVQSYLDKSIGLNELANLLGMNVHSFWKLFKRSTGMPPHQYVIRCRISRAQILLKQQRKISIAEIALQCGFADRSHLHRHFRKYLGVTPGAYRDR